MIGSLNAETAKRIVEERKRGGRYTAIDDFEDETALYETTLFPEEFGLYRHLLFEQRPLVVRGLVEDNRGAITVTISSIQKT
jgi:DNA polymerase III alpha subunit